MNHPACRAASRWPRSVAPRMANLAVERALGRDERVEHLNSPDGSGVMICLHCLLRKGATSLEANRLRDSWLPSGPGARAVREGKMALYGI